jgi:hypothetical protein
MLFSADQIKSWDVQQCNGNGIWTQARPMSWPGFNLKRRLTAAWMVFTGRADVLTWNGVEQ